MTQENKIQSLKHLKKSIELIDEAFVEARKTKFDFQTEENLTMIYDGIGNMRSCLMDVLIKQNKK